jgi:hypothetical protein
MESLFNQVFEGTSFYNFYRQSHASIRHDSQPFYPIVGSANLDREWSKLEDVSQSHTNKSKKQKAGKSNKSKNNKKKKKNSKVKAKHPVSESRDEASKSFIYNLV